MIAGIYIFVMICTYRECCLEQSDTFVWTNNSVKYTVLYTEFQTHVPKQEVK